MNRKSNKKTRISLSISDDLAQELDKMVVKRGFGSRSQAVSEMLETQLVEFKEELGVGVMAGTITLIYDRTKANCQQRVADIQYKYIIEIISSLAINLENHQMMEVLLVQGPANSLKQLADQLVIVKGVKTCKLNLNTSILPPLHKRTDADAMR